MKISLRQFLKIFIKWSFISIPLLYLFISVPLHTGYKEGYESYFVNATFISLLIATFTTKSFYAHLKKSTLGLFVFVCLTTLFWGYMDHPWFAGPETNTCDGPCFGWFSFENFDPSIFIFLSGIVMMFVTGISKTIMLFIVKKLEHKTYHSLHKKF